MTLLDDDLQVDGGQRAGEACPHCGWRFLQAQALEAHVAVQHDAGGAAWRRPGVIAGD